ncbi:MAG TPA: RICIN domain-containing protein [Acidobacteriaceae bacterium]|nr:RICIN domain-containing protein [Acidobacteriaceae bacterium]
MDNAANGVQGVVSLSGVGTGETGVADGTYTITTPSSGLLLDDPGSSTAAGTNIDAYPATGNPNEQWTFGALGGGYYETVNAYSGLSLNDPASSTASGTLLIRYPYQGTSNEAWLLTPLREWFYHYR